MSNIYELTNEYLQLLDMMNDEDIDPEVLADTFEGIEGELEIKAENYWKVRTELSGKADMIANEIKRLQAMKKGIENNIDRIDSTLEKTMIATGKRKFKTDLFSFSIAKKPAALKLADDINFDDVPPEFIKWAEPTIDKTAVKNAIKEGNEFEWASLEQGEGLRVR